MGVAGDPFHDSWEPKTEKDKRRLADKERRRRILHPAWHRERDREVREPFQQPVGTSRRPPEDSEET
jgi:hypothetical protein